MRANLALSASIAALLLVGCSNPFPPEEIVEKPRPLAGWISVAGDPDRATPAPGETATYEFLVENPGPRVAWSWLLIVCPVATTQYGISICDFQASWAPTDWPTATVNPPAGAPPYPNPSITFTVPSTDVLGPDSDQLLINGFICPGGPLDPGIFEALAAGDAGALSSVANPCMDKSANGLLIATPFGLELTPEDANNTPLITDVQLNGLPLTSVADPEAPTTGCAGLGLYELEAGTAYLPIDLTLNPGSRETYVEPSPVPGEPSTTKTDDPQVTGYATGGDYDIRVDNQREDGQVLQITWQTPPASSIPADGVLVNLTFLVQDDRKATSWAQRSVCVLPPSNP